VLVANLPYGVAATVVLRFLEIMPKLRTATIMVQAEVADRMAAVPGTKAYGAYTVKLGLLATPVARFKVSRGSFLPPPRVDSAVIRLERTTRSGVSAEELTRAARTADAAFCQRRKTLRNSLAAGLGVPAATVERTLTSEGFDPSRRAETLSVDDYIRLGSVLHAQGLA
jgi:16S rRNA (adenine1518-N6/adenine1519-N6)-dimethyltransferase